MYILAHKLKILGTKIHVQNCVWLTPVNHSSDFLKISRPNCTNSSQMLRSTLVKNLLKNSRVGLSEGDLFFTVFQLNFEGQLICEYL